MPGYDVIGDVHGRVDKLRGLLDHLGYKRSDGAWRHEERTAVFVGDLIDRAPEGQLDAVRLVRAMVDVGSARLVLGNHEFNAVAYAAVNPATLDYCRRHTDKNRNQHEHFLDEVGFDTPLHRAIIDWFRTVPLWLDLNGLRVVHACWSPDDLDHLSSVLTEDRWLTDAAVIQGTTKGNRTYDAIENVLKGPEVDMNGAHYYDKDGHPRGRARARWWDAHATTLRAAAHLPGDAQLYDDDNQSLDALPDRALAAGEIPRYTDPVPVIVGHYWRTGTPELISSHLACVDYSAGTGGPLVAYRWDGEAELDQANFEQF